MLLFRSLRARLITSFVLIVVITLSFAGLTLYAVFRGYREELTSASLKQIAAPIYYNLTVPSAFTTTPRGGRALRQELLDYVRTQSAESGVFILFLDGRGLVIEDFVADANPFEGDVFFVPDPPVRAPNFAALPEGTHTTTAGETMAFVIVPTTQQIRNQDPSIHAVVVAMPESAGPDVYRDLRQRLVLSGIVGSMAALVAGLLLWLSLYRPLARVTTGIRAVAAGNYRGRVPEQGPSEVRALAHDVNAMADAVDASQRTLRDFLANVSHELKTPLTSIRGFSQALQDGTLETEEERVHAARIIDAESRRLLHLVGELLDLSRIESGQQRMNIAAINAGELLGHVRDVFAIRAEELGVALVIQGPDAGIVNADFDRIEQVLGNLLDNALRHAPRGSSILLNARRSGTVVEFSVADEGPGIATDDLPHVFDRFYRSQDETAGSGAGLGLAIAKEIVRAHGGAISAVSNARGGSTFRFTLPAAPAADTEAAGPVTPDVDAPQPQPGA